MSKNNLQILQEMIETKGCSGLQCNFCPLDVECDNYYAATGSMPSDPEITKMADKMMRWMQDDDFYEELEKVLNKPDEPAC